MTGLYPHVFGHRSMRHMLGEHEPHLLSVLRREGYYVWWGGKNDLVAVRDRADYLRHCDHKFDPAGRYCEHMPYRKARPLAPDDPRHGAYYGGVLTRGGDGPPHYDQDTAWVLGAVDMIMNRPPERPFVCYLPLGKPHPAYFAEEDFYQAIDPDRLPPRIPGEGARLAPVLQALRQEYRSLAITEEMWRDVKRLYYAACAKVDALLGLVVDALERAGILDQTWVIFWSDHGDFTGDYSLPEKTHSTLQDCLLRVPLIMRPPAAVPVRPGLRRHLTELLDVSATLYDLLEIDPGYATQGLSLRASLAGDDTPMRDAVYAEVGGRPAERGFINTEVLSMPPQSFYARQSRAAIPFHEAGSHAFMCRTLEHKYIRRCYSGHHELFDLASDPAELRNLAGDPAFAAIEREMEGKLLDHLLRTCDVLPFHMDSRAI